MDIKKVFSDGSICGAQIKNVITGLERRENWALRMFGFWQLQPAASPSELFYHCRDFKANSTQGLYCSTLVEAIVPRQSNYSAEISEFQKIIHAVLKRRVEPSFWTGVCIPSSCIWYDFQKYSNQILAPMGYQTSSTKCYTETKTNSFDKLVILFLVLLLAVCIFSSTYDLIMKSRKKKPVKILTAFSIPQNFSDLFKINNSSSVINCIDGLKVQSTIWVIIGHRRIYSSTPQYEFLWRAWWESIVLQYFNAHNLSMDIFLTCSAILMVNSIMKSTKIRFSIKNLITSRYFRSIFPVIVVTMLLKASILMYLADGPKDGMMAYTIDRCQSWWWMNFIFIQNYGNNDKICGHHTWYLALDFQLFIAATLVIASLRRFGQKSYKFIALIVWIFQCYKFYTFHVLQTPFFPIIYSHFEYRLGEYLVGILGGYLIFMYKDKELGLSRTKIIIGWVVAMTILTRQYFYALREPPITLFDKMYASIWMELYAAALCWVIFACHFLKTGGYIRTFLSYRIWQPFSRMCLSVFLMHYIYVLVSMASQKQTVRFFMWWQIHVFAGDIFIGFVLGMIFYLVVEAPSMHLVNIIMTKNKKEDEPKPIDHVLYQD